MIDISTIWNLVKDVAVVVSVPVFVSVAGWAENALEDGLISDFEWKQLLATVIRVGSIGIMGYFGLNLFGVEQSALIASVSSFFADKLFRSLKKNEEDF